MSMVAGILKRHWILAIRIDAVFFNGLADRLLVQNAIVGQRLEGCDRDVALIDFKMLA